MESNSYYVVIPGGEWMSYMEDLKTDKDKQITVACIAFFLLAFPTYFTMASTIKDTGPLVMSSGQKDDYVVNGTFTYHEIGSGTETIQHEGTSVVGAHSDAGDVDGMNIVGFRVIIEHTDDETGGGPQCTGVATEDDEVSVNGGINEASATGSGTESPMEVSFVWIDQSILGTIVQNKSMGEISSMLDGGDTGFGEYSFDISVNTNAGSRVTTGCNRQDNQETVDWTIELISLEYTAEAI